jgi:ketosteroid isomerase-like protein
VRIGSLVVCLLAAAAAVGCEDRENTDVKAAAASLLQTDHEFAAASLEHGAADAFRMYLDDDATMFSNGRNPVRGRESIYEIMKAGDGAYVLEWTPMEAEVARSGELGWTWGEFVVKSKGEAATEPQSWGKYVNVWKKNTAGEWKVIADIGNDSPPPGETNEGPK